METTTNLVTPERYIELYNVVIEECERRGINTNTLPIESLYEGNTIKKNYLSAIIEHLDLINNQNNADYSNVIKKEILDNLYERAYQYSQNTDGTDCSANCTGFCSGDCFGSCWGDCFEECGSDCTTDCTGGCSGDCVASCIGDCEGTCVGGCQDTCGGSCIDSAF